MRNRAEDYKSKSFNIGNQRDAGSMHAAYAGIPAIDYNKIKVGTQILDDAIITLDTLKKVNPRLADKEAVLRAINNYDLVTMREVSDFFYKISGIYSRILRYMAFMYRYDWMVTPYINDETME